MGAFTLMKGNMMNEEESLVRVGKEVKKFIQSFGINMRIFSRLFGYRGDSITAGWLKGTMKMPDDALEWTIKLNNFLAENPPPQRWEK